MKLAHKIQLIPTPKQEIYLRRASGTARFAYNWGLAEWNRQYAAGEKTSRAGLNKRLNELKREQFPWMYKVTKSAPEAALADLGMAFQNYFRDLKKPVKQRHFQYPVFKKKFVAKDKFYLANDQFGVEEKRIRLPHLGWVRMQENLRFEGKILSATVAREADRWVVAVIVETEIEVPIRSENQTPVGIDLGIHQAAMLSTGKTFTAPMSLATNLQKLKRLQRQLARKKTGSKNRDKARMRLARQHRRVANARADFLHKLTTNLARRYDTIFLEDLDVVAMLKNHQLARALSDVGMGEFRRQIEYKTQLQGGQVVFVDRYFPSSKQCRKCGQKNEQLTLADRVFRCSFCGHREDRDLNAARNILAEGQRILKTTGGTPGSQACGPADSLKHSRFGGRRNEAGSGLTVSKTPTISSQYA